MVQAGTLNLTGPLTLEATATADLDSFLAEMIRMMEAAEGGRARYRRIAERVSALYAPVVHLTAFVTFIGWMVCDGDWHQALTIAIAVLIITCPCALGLAVPIVQVVAARRLFEAGIMVKDGSAMERLAEADAVVFDKTGTLTLGRPRLVGRGPDRPGRPRPRRRARRPFAPSALAGDRSRGRTGLHPLRRRRRTARLRRRGPRRRPCLAARPRRLGDASAALATARFSPATASRSPALRSRTGCAPEPAPRSREAERIVGPVEMLSGDSEAACAQVAQSLGIDRYRSGLLPADKVARLIELSLSGNRVLMVGDGLNDAPALGAAHVSMAPASAADIGRNAADFVFLRESLDAVPLARDIAVRAGHLIRQNIALAIVYNAIAVPIAILGYVTPLIAAIAMSASSIIVIANALRLSPPGPRRAAGDATDAQPDTSPGTGIRTARPA